jgi:hypothetical protein
MYKFIGPSFGEDTGRGGMLAAMHHGFHLRFGHGNNLHWYEVVLLPLAFVVVYPDRTLRLCFPKADKIYQLVLFELTTIGLLVAGTALLRKRYSDLEWWMPVALVAFCVLVRVILFCINLI